MVRFLLIAIESLGGKFIRRDPKTWYCFNSPKGPRRCTMHSSLAVSPSRGEATLNKRTVCALEWAVSALALLFSVATFLAPTHWIEGVLHVDLDANSGALELLVGALAFVVGTTFGLLGWSNRSGIRTAQLAAQSPLRNHEGARADGSSVPSPAAASRRNLSVDP